MFFKKRRDAAKAKAAQERQKVLDDFQVEIDAALKIPAADERLLALEKIKDAVVAVKDGTEKVITGKAQNKLFLPYFAVTGSSVAGAAAIVSALALNPAFMVLAMVPGIFGGFGLGAYFSKRAMKKMEEEFKPFFTVLDEKKTALETAIPGIVRDNIKDLAASPKFAELQSKPGLRDSFMAALQQHVTQPEEKPQPKKPDGPGFRI